MKVKCPCCKGAKAIMGPGCIYKPCKECKGKGEIEREEPKINQELKSALDELKELPGKPVSEMTKDDLHKVTLECLIPGEQMPEVVKELLKPEKKKNSRSKK